MKMYQTTYEIHDVNTNEILVDNLDFADMAEQFAVYQNFYGDNAVVACSRTYSKVTKIETTAQLYKDAWIEYFGELQLMGNLA